MKKTIFKKVIPMLLMTSMFTAIGVATSSVALAATLDEPQIYKEVYFERYDGDYGIVKIQLKEGCYFTEESEAIAYDGENTLEVSTLFIDKEIKKDYWDEATLLVKGTKHGQVYSFELSNVILDNSGKKQTVTGSFKASTASQTRYAKIGTPYYRTIKTSGGSRRTALERVLPPEVLK